MEPVDFMIGALSQRAAEGLAVAVLLYAGATGYYAWRGFQTGLADRWSALLATLVMVALAALLRTDGARVLPAPFSVWLLVVYLAGIVVTLTWTLGRYQERIDRFREQFGARLNALLAERLPEDRLAEWRRLRDRFQGDEEGRRKTPHLLMGVFLVIYLVAGRALLRGVADLADATLDGGEAVANLYLASHSGYLVAGHVTALFGLMGLLFLVLPNELLRLKYPELSYPFKATILQRLREREKGLFGAHYYIVATLPLAAIGLTRDPATWTWSIPAVIAVVCVTVFADAASALVGIRFGRRKWFHHAGKSYLGTVGGMVVAFLVALPFIGVPGGVAAAVVFAAVDALSPVPFPASDNILHPVALAAAFLVLDGAVSPLFPFY